MLRAKWGPIPPPLVDRFRSRVAERWGCGIGAWMLQGQFMNPASIARTRLSTRLSALLYELALWILRSGAFSPLLFPGFRSGKSRCNQRIQIDTSLTRSLRNNSLEHKLFEL